MNTDSLGNEAKDLVSVGVGGGERGWGEIGVGDRGAMREEAGGYVREEGEVLVETMGEELPVAKGDGFGLDARVSADVSILRMDSGSFPGFIAGPEMGLVAKGVDSIIVISAFFGSEGIFCCTISSICRRMAALASELAYEG